MALTIDFSETAVDALRKLPLEQQRAVHHQLTIAAIYLEKAGQVAQPQDMQVAGQHVRYRVERQAERLFVEVIESQRGLVGPWRRSKEDSKKKGLTVSARTETQGG